MAAISVALLGYEKTVQTGLADYFRQQGWEVADCSELRMLLRALRYGGVQTVVLGPGLHLEAVALGIVPVLKELFSCKVVVNAFGLQPVELNKLRHAGVDFCINYHAAPVDIGEALTQLERATKARQSEPFGDRIPPLHARPRLSEPIGEVSGRWTLKYQGWTLLTPIGELVHLSAVEHTIFKSLLNNPRRELPHYVRQELFPSIAFRSFNVIISRLRQKVAKKGHRLPLQTVRSMGYVFTGELLADTTLPNVAKGGE